MTGVPPPSKCLPMTAVHINRKLGYAAGSADILMLDFRPLNQFGSDVLVLCF